LSAAATATVGPTSVYVQGHPQEARQQKVMLPAKDTTQDTTQVMANRMNALIEFCAEPRSKREMGTAVGSKQNQDDDT